MVSFFVSDFNFVSFHISSKRLHLDTYDIWLYNIKLGQPFPVCATSNNPPNTEISPKHFKLLISYRAVNISPLGYENQ